MEVIVACAINNGIIGYKQSIPWKISADMQYFKEITSSCPDGMTNVVIMGRNTWMSLPNSLSNRVNIVVSTSLTHASNAILCSSLQDAIEYAQQRIHNIHKIFVIGGASLYKEALMREDCTCVHVTYVHNYEGNGDTFFPLNVLHNLYKCVDASEILQTYDNMLYSFTTYIKK